MQRLTLKRSALFPENLLALLNNFFFRSRLGLYLMIGGTASAIDVGVFIYLYEFIGLSAVASHSISIPLSAIFSFSLNALFNFKKTDKIFYRALSFSTVVLFGYLLGAAIILFVEELLGLNGTIGKIISLPFVFFIQFYLNSKISFGD